VCVDLTAHVHVKLETGEKKAVMDYFKVLSQYPLQETKENQRKPPSEQLVT